MSVQVTADTQARAPARGAATVSRLAGTGGLVFAATLAVQNILRAAAPGFGAAPAQVTAYFLHHRTAALVPLGLFPAGMLALFLFAAAVGAGRPGGRPVVGGRGHAGRGGHRRPFRRREHDRDRPRRKGGAAGFLPGGHPGVVDAYMRPPSAWTWQPSRSR